MNEDVMLEQYAAQIFDSLVAAARTRGDDPLEDMRGVRKMLAIQLRLADEAIEAMTAKPKKRGRK
ncbi:hypothetical protein [Mangrovicoccus ximenensis]|uniref:hypothetical protein n=1 Tax=Mangrovicoccus ximenensis TaxID=1911570 RepID=UPI000D3764F2|nr:hypothetical protein [Mangrovicoccus ximenensis]